MTKKKDPKRKDANAKKAAVEALCFQTHWGLKKLGLPEGNLSHFLADMEICQIVELELVQELMSVTSFVKDVKQQLSVEPTPSIGDFSQSITAIALGIAHVNDIESINTPISWNDVIKKKLMTIFYNENKRNAVVSWAKENGYNTSTYLGKPIVKFQHIYLVIDRLRDQ